MMAQALQPDAALDLRWLDSALGCLDLDMTDALPGSINQQVREAGVKPIGLKRSHLAHAASSVPRQHSAVRHVHRCKAIARKVMPYLAL